MFSNHFATTHPHEPDLTLRLSSNDTSRTTSVVGSNQQLTSDDNTSSEMFGRRKMQLVLDVSRVLDIKVRQLLELASTSRVTG